MRALRPALGVLAVAAAALAGPRSALAQVPATPAYPATLHFGTGLVTIPVAWVSPESGDLWANASGTLISSANTAALDIANDVNVNGAIDTHWMGRFSAGVALYSANFDFGFFGQALLLRDGEAPGLPSVAVGVRNLGNSEHADRHLLAEDQKGAAAFARDLDTRPTLYAVATKEIRGERMSGSLSVGYGNGLFKDDGDLDSLYNDKGQIAEGLFLGGRLAIAASPTTTVTLLAENNGFDWNAGLVASWHGVSVGIYGLELEEGGKESSALGALYNYTKFAFTVGYSANLQRLVHGSTLRSEVADLEREQERLRGEIAQRERRVAELQRSLQDTQSGQLAEAQKRRAELEKQLREERDAIQRAEERLRALERPPAPPPGGTTPQAR
ncbi:MAG TPA: hypothetical protein VFK13_11480 [Gemmatimonadaceae bacterium]|nr:hypothetical protein [Gemmatimonadaceae bacterium]